MSLDTIQLSKLDLTKSTSVKTNYLRELKDGTLELVPEETVVNIAPLNAINNFLSIINTTFVLLLQAPEEEIPKKFTWNDGKKDISKVFEQYNCGCCWAISTVQTINDVIICNKLLQLKKNPNIDPTNILVCMKGNNNMCKGGNALDALEYIQKKGIEFKGLTYKWCSTNKKCKNPSPPAPETPMFVLNGLLPKKCPKKKSIRFYVQNIKHFIVPHKERTNKKKIKNCVERVKEHILNNGPVIGGYMVYNNFLKGNFLKKGNLHGIYFDQYDYEKDEYSEIPFSVNGPHSVSIVGWGYDDNVDGKFIGEKAGTKHTVEYWIVRNSWGEKWGIEGYFRLAMYPFNKNSQFEVSLNVEGYKKQSLEYGGILAFETSIIPNHKNVESFSYPHNNINNYKWILLIILFLLLFYKILL